MMVFGQATHYLSIYSCIYLCDFSLFFLNDQLVFFFFSLVTFPFRLSMSSDDRFRLFLSEKSGTKPVSHVPNLTVLLEFSFVSFFLLFAFSSVLDEKKICLSTSNSSVVVVVYHISSRCFSAHSRPKQCDGCSLFVCFILKSFFPSSSSLVRVHICTR